jgi:hypothetical protein
VPLLVIVADGELVCSGDRVRAHRNRRTEAWSREEALGAEAVSPHQRGVSRGTRHGKCTELTPVAVELTLEVPVDVGVAVLVAVMDCTGSAAGGGKTAVRLV